MFDKQPLFCYEFTINLVYIGAFLKKFSQKTSYTIFGRPFTPIQQSSKFVATKIGSTLKQKDVMFSVCCWINHIVSCLISKTITLRAPFN